VLTRTLAAVSAAGFVLAAILTAVSCSNSVSPGTGLTVRNVTDSFEYQVTDMRKYTRSMAYSWVNTGTQATVSQASDVTGGKATLLIVDSDGTAVFSKSLTENGAFITRIGTSGTWTIRIFYSDVTATVDFRVEKR
jgi:hypothetical protein